MKADIPESRGGIADTQVLNNSTFTWVDTVDDGILPTPKLFPDFYLLSLDAFTTSSPRMTKADFVAMALWLSSHEVQLNAIWLQDKLKRPGILAVVEVVVQQDAASPAFVLEGCHLSLERIGHASYCIRLSPEVKAALIQSGWISVYEGLGCPYIGVSLAQSLASELGQLNSGPPAAGSVINPVGHHLRLRFTLEVVVEKLGRHPFEDFHQSIALKLQSFVPSATIPPSDFGSERFEAQSMQIVSIQPNPGPKLYSHSVRYSFQCRDNQSFREMHFTWHSSASSRLWQFVSDDEPILRDEAAMHWMLGLPDFRGGSYEHAFLRVPVLFNETNKELADEICQHLGVNLPSKPDNSIAQRATDTASLLAVDYFKFDPFQMYRNFRVKRNIGDLSHNTDLLLPFDWESFNEPIWLLSGCHRADGC